MAIIFKNQTDMTSDEIPIRVSDGVTYTFDLWIYGDLGSGSVSVELKNSEGDFVQFADLVFTEGGGYTISSRSTGIKIIVAGATDVTVEVI